MFKWLLDKFGFGLDFKLFLAGGDCRIWTRIPLNRDDDGESKQQPHFFI
jgi:hypothetical protein